MPRPNKGPYLSTGKAGRYDIAWTENGRSRRRSTGTSDFRKAQKILAQFILLEDRERRELIEVSDELLVSDILGDPDAPPRRAGEPRPQDYWHEHCLPNVNSLVTQGANVRRLLGYFGHMAVRSIKSSDVTNYIWAREEGEIGRPATNGGINRELSVLVAAINHAVREKRLKTDDAPKIKLLPPAAPKDRWLTRDEAARLLEAAKAARTPRVFKFVVLALGTASRKGAIQTLRPSQIDLENNIISLNPPGRRQTKKRRSEVPISSWLRPYIVDMLKDVRGDDYILGSSTDIWESFNRAVVRAGLSEDVTPHTLRHTWATWAAQAGMSMVDIAAILGDTIHTVMKNYLHHSPDHLKKAINGVAMPSFGETSALTQNSAYVLSANVGQHPEAAE